MDKVIESLKENFGGDIQEVVQAFGETTVVVSRSKAKEVLRFLRDSQGFEMLTDLTAVDWLGKKQPRFQVVYHLHSYGKNLRLRVKVPTDAQVDSVVDIWPGAGFMERECWEMFGIDFKDNPELTHILLWDGFPGYPLRKDFHWREDIPLPENK